jgi:hypothetical protein
MPRIQKGRGCLLALLLLGFLEISLHSQASPAAHPKDATATTGQKEPTESSTEDLQKATQNPVASLISVPVQNNSNFGIGSFNRVQNVLNIQPVVPLGLTNS